MTTIEALGAPTIITAHLVQSDVNQQVLWIDDIVYLRNQSIKLAD
jgi:hypothetical protein